MKKILIFSIFAICASTFIACSSCKNEKKNVNNDTIQTTMVVENIISTDREDMFSNVSKDYRWFETCIHLNKYLDEENDGSIDEIVNTFQVVIDYGKSMDVKVYRYKHLYNGEVVTDSISDFVLGDEPLEKQKITVTFKRAFDNLMATNLPKPHSRYCVLRKEAGWLECNPQYIFGNTQAQVYVDAVTGEVRDYNPAFPKDKQLNYAFSWQ